MYTRPAVKTARERLVAVGQYLYAPLGLWSLSLRLSKLGLVLREGEGGERENTNE